MPAGDPIVLVALIKLLDRVGAGGVKQPESRFAPLTSATTNDFATRLARRSIAPTRASAASTATAATAAAASTVKPRQRCQAPGRTAARSRSKACSSNRRLPASSDGAVSLFDIPPANRADVRLKRCAKSEQTGTGRSKCLQETRRTGGVRSNCQIKQQVLQPL